MPDITPIAVTFTADISAVETKMDQMVRDIERDLGLLKAAFRAANGELRIAPRSDPQGLATLRDYRNQIATQVDQVTANLQRLTIQWEQSAQRIAAAEAIINQPVRGEGGRFLPRPDPGALEAAQQSLATERALQASLSERVGRLSQFATASAANPGIPQPIPAPRPAASAAAETERAAVPAVETLATEAALAKPAVTPLERDPETGRFLPRGGSPAGLPAPEAQTPAATGLTAPQVSAIQTTPTPPAPAEVLPSLEPTPPQKIVQPIPAAEVTPAIAPQPASLYASPQTAAPAESSTPQPGLPKIGDQIEYEPNGIGVFGNKAKGVVTGYKQDPTTGDHFPMVGNDPVTTWYDSGKVIKQAAQLDTKPGEPPAPEVSTTVAPTVAQKVIQEIPAADVTVRTAEEDRRTYVEDAAQPEGQRPLVKQPFEGAASREEIDAFFQKSAGEHAARPELRAVADAFEQRGIHRDLLDALATGPRALGPRAYGEPDRPFTINPSLDKGFEPEDEQRQVVGRFDPQTNRVSYVPGEVPTEAITHEIGHAVDFMQGISHGPAQEWEDQGIDPPHKKVVAEFASENKKHSALFGHDKGSEYSGDDPGLRKIIRQQERFAETFAQHYHASDPEATLAETPRSHQALQSFLRGEQGAFGGPPPPAPPERYEEALTHAQGRESVSSSSLRRALGGLSFDESQNLLDALTTEGVIAPRENGNLLKGRRLLPAAPPPAPVEPYVQPYDLLSKREKIERIRQANSLSLEERADTFRTPADEYAKDPRAAIHQRLTEHQDYTRENAALATFEKRAGREGATLYHGTGDAVLPDILREGLKRGNIGNDEPGEGAKVYATRNRDTANFYASGSTAPGGEPVIIRVRQTPEEMRANREQQEHYRLDAETAEHGRSFSNPIPPERITGVASLTEQGGFGRFVPPEKYQAREGSTRILEPRDSLFSEGQVVSASEFRAHNREVLEAGGYPATGRPHVEESAQLEPQIKQAQAELAALKAEQKAAGGFTNLGSQARGGDGNAQRILTEISAKKAEIQSLIDRLPERDSATTRPAGPQATGPATPPTTAAGGAGGIVPPSAVAPPSAAPEGQPEREVQAAQQRLAAEQQLKAALQEEDLAVARRLTAEDQLAQKMVQAGGQKTEAVTSQAAVVDKAIAEEQAAYERTTQARTKLAQTTSSTTTEALATETTAVQEAATVTQTSAAETAAVQQTAASDVQAAVTDSAAASTTAAQQSAQAQKEGATQTRASQRETTDEARTSAKAQTESTKEATSAKVDGAQKARDASKATATEEAADARSAATATVTAEVSKTAQLRAQLAGLKAERKAALAEVAQAEKNLGEIRTYEGARAAAGNQQSIAAIRQYENELVEATARQEQLTLSIEETNAALKSLGANTEVVATRISGSFYKASLAGAELRELIGIGMPRAMEIAIAHAPLMAKALELAFPVLLAVQFGEILAAIVNKTLEWRDGLLEVAEYEKTIGKQLDEQEAKARAANKEQREARFKLIGETEGKGAENRARQADLTERIKTESAGLADAQRRYHETVLKIQEDRRILREPDKVFQTLEGQTILEDPRKEKARKDLGVSGPITGAIREALGGEAGGEDIFKGPLLKQRDEEFADVQRSQAELRRDATQSGVDAAAAHNAESAEAKRAAHEKLQALRQADEEAFATLEADHRLTVREEISFWEQRLAVEKQYLERRLAIRNTLGHLYQRRDDEDAREEKQGIDRSAAAAREAGDTTREKTGVGSGAEEELSVLQDYAATLDQKTATYEEVYARILKLEAEVDRQQQQDLIKADDEAYRKLKATQVVGLADEEAFWNAIINTADHGSTRYKNALKELDGLQERIIQQQQRIAQLKEEDAAARKASGFKQQEEVVRADSGISPDQLGKITGTKITEPAPLPTPPTKTGKVLSAIGAFDNGALEQQQLLTAIHQQEYQEAIAANERQQQIYAKNPEKLQDLLDKQHAIENRYHQQQIQDTAATIKAMGAPYLHFIQLIDQAFFAGVNQWLQGQKTFAAAMAQTWNSIVLGVVIEIEKMTAKWIEAHLVMALVDKLFATKIAQDAEAWLLKHIAITAVKKTTETAGDAARLASNTVTDSAIAASNAAVVAAYLAGQATEVSTATASQGAVAAVTLLANFTLASSYAGLASAEEFAFALAQSLGDIPYASAMAAAAYGIGEGYASLAAFETGGIIPNTGIALVHENEGVLPAPLTKMLTAAANGNAYSDAPIVPASNAPLSPGSAPTAGTNVSNIQNTSKGGDNHVHVHAPITVQGGGNATPDMKQALTDHADLIGRIASSKLKQFNRG